MNWFCEHDWKKIKETYAEPIEFDSASGRGSGERIHKMVCGVTTILWECSKCHDIRKEELLGKAI